LKLASVFAGAFALAALASGQQANATTVNVAFSAPGLSGSLLLTYGSATDATYSTAYELTGISGTFSDSNNGLNIVNEAVTALVPVNHATPESTNLLAPHDFSKFSVASGTAHGSLSYDNLFWPGGSPQTATSYPPHGGFLDIYGLLFGISNGDVVNFWSDGVTTGTTPAYGVTVATSATVLDSNFNGVNVPEPGSFALLGAGLVLLAGVSVGSKGWQRKATPGT
jgi:hypothetical protein